MPTLSRVFLYSDLTETFEPTSAPFIAAAGGRSARIAWLVPRPHGWARFLPLYRDPWLRLGAAEVVPIVPAGDPPALSGEAIEALARCSGIFVCGGDTRDYHRLYVRGPARDVIRARHAAGVPYAGLSAGALIASDPCTVWGDRLTTLGNACLLRGADDGCRAELETGEGLGLIGGCLVEPHLSERGGFPRLVAAMERIGAARGLGIDDAICAEIEDRSLVRIHGRGRAYLLEAAGSGRLGVRVFEPGAVFRLGEG